MMWLGAGNYWHLKRKTGKKCWELARLCLHVKAWRLSVNSCHLHKKKKEKKGKGKARGRKETEKEKATHA